MGDCRLKIVVSRFANATEEKIIIKTYASDTTIREVRDDVLHSLSEQKCMSVWDCTTHPPRDISTWLFVEFPDHKGPKSKTLFDAGCFPSAVWQVLPHDVQPLARSVMEDSQYNRNVNNESLLAPSVNVDLVGVESYLKPSQVLDSVTKRFTDDVDDTEAAIKTRRKIHMERRAKEADRNFKLEERIQKLKSINSSTSLQVRTMLLKSRCTGSKSLEIQDRVYFHVALVNGDTISEHFLYFSRQDTVARVVERFAPKLPQEAEFLVLRPDQRYRRLPNRLRLYEAIEKGLVKGADSVVIRYFCPLDEEPSTSAIEDEAGSVDEPTTPASHSTHTVESPCTIATEHSSAPIQAISQDLIDHFKCALAELDKKSKSKKSSSAVKVREMTMKSKAKGDVKRIPKMENRFFLELILVEDGPASSSFVFMARNDTLDRVVMERMKGECQVFAITNDGSFLALPMEHRVKDLEARNLLRCFDRVVVTMLQGY